MQQDPVRSIVRKWSAEMCLPLALALSLLAVAMLSSGCARRATPTPPQPVRIAQLVEINGVSQFLDIRGQSSAFPILLFIHGGPGTPETVLVNHYNQALEEHFIVVNWDQRGAGASYVKQVPPVETMTVDQFLADTHEVTSYLKKTFNKEKIYLVGHSWGSLLGILTAAKYPEDYYAYIGIGQLAQWDESYALNYQAIYQIAQQDGNAEAIGELQSISSEPYQTFDFRDMAKLGVYMKWTMHYGGSVHALKDQTIPTLIGLIQESDVYRQFGVTPEKYNEANGFTASLLQQQVSRLHPRDLVQELKIPVYIMGGRWDAQVSTTVAREFFDSLKAPRKQFFLFEDSAHMPPFEEPEKFLDIMVNTVLKETAR